MNNNRYKNQNVCERNAPGFKKDLSFLLKVNFVILLSLVINMHGLKAQEALDVNWQQGSYNKWLEFSDAENSIYHHLSDQVYNLLEKRTNEVNSINSLSEWQQRQSKLKETFAEIVGPFPERNPLNAKILRTVEKDNYYAEHIVFESQPGFYVTSTLFIPAGLKKNIKSPVVIYCSGHSADGYHNRSAQNMILNLVYKGFMVFAFDPVGQGERIEYPDPETGKSMLGGPTKEHSYPGTQTIISGSSQAMYMIWDGIRSVDYLLSRKDVDPERIGITGCSGGGTQSAFISALDERIYAAVPQCYITSYKRLFQSKGPQDAEQNMFNAIARGIDHADFLAVRAPKPALVMSTTEDFFSIQGARETVKEVSRIYKAYGKEDHFGMAEDMGPHGSTRKTREAMYGFFRKHFNNPGNTAEEEVEILTPEEIRVTPAGQISTSYKGETVFSINSAETESLIKKLEAARKDLDSHLPKVLEAAEKLSGYKQPAGFTEPALTGQIKREGYIIQKYFIYGEGEYIVPYLLMVPERPNGKALMYIHPSGKKIEASENGEMEWFVRNGFTVLAPDLLGIGETGPGDFKGDAYIDGYSHNIWYATMLIGRSVVGIRAGDIARLVMLLKSNNDINDIYGIAKKEMSPVLIHAAAFNPDIKRIALIEPYSSYRSVVQNHFYNSAFIHSTVPAALEVYDIPDLAAALAPRKLLLAGVTDGNSKISDQEAINKDLNVIKSSYQQKNSSAQLIIVTGGNLENLQVLYKDWLN